jgi:hypothetical protein
VVLEEDIDGKMEGIERQGRRHNSYWMTLKLDNTEN